MSDRKDLAVERKVAARMFRDPDVLAVLDAIEEVALLVPLVGRPVVRQSWERSGWDDRDPRPALASDDPAVMCAIGRCAASRIRRGERP